MMKVALLALGVGFFVALTLSAGARVTLADLSGYAYSGGVVLGIVSGIIIVWSAR